MNSQKITKQRKVLLYFALIIFGVEIYFWDDILRNISSLDFSTIYKTLGIYVILKGLIIYGAIEILSVLFMDKLINKFISKKKIQKIKVLRYLLVKKIKRRWKRYSIWEKSIIFFAFLQLLIAILGVLFYMPVTRRHAAKTVGKKAGRKLIFVLLAFIPVKVLTTWIEWFIAIPLIEKLKRGYKLWRIKKRRKKRSASI